MCYGLNFDIQPLQKGYVGVLTPSTPQCDLIWRQGLYRGK